jgi:hypothetical protein
MEETVVESLRLNSSAMGHPKRPRFLPAGGGILPQAYAARAIPRSAGKKTELRDDAWAK